MRCRVAVLSSIVLACAGVSAAAEPVDTIVRGGTVVTVDREFRLIDDGAVAVKAGRIVAVGPRAEIVEKFTATETIDAAGHAILPGLVNTHGHVPMTLFRGVADDLQLMQWLQKYIFPAEARVVDEAFVRCGTRLGCLEMLLGGTTTYCDMYYFESAIADETSRAGMRGVLGQTIIDFPAPDFKTWNAAIEGVRAFARQWKDHPLITPAIAPHSPYTVSTEHLNQARALADELGIPLKIHLAETRAEVDIVRKQHGASPVAYLERIGLLGGPTIAAHVVWPDDDDLPTLAKRGVGVAHCPQSNMKLASGVAPVPKLLAAGVAVGLGTDGAASNNDLDLWEEIDTAAKLHKLTSGDPTVLPAQQALELATIGGARALHMAEKIGSLEAGKHADLIVVRLDGPHQTPLYHLASHLVYATKAADVRHVMVEGRLLVRDRVAQTIDAGAVRAQAAEYRDRIRAAVDNR